MKKPPARASRTPSAPPKMPVTAASARMSVATSLRVAPTARMTPISRVRSRTSAWKAWAMLTAASAVMSAASRESASVTSSTAAPICKARFRSLSSMSKPMRFTTEAISPTCSERSARKRTLE